MYLQLHFLFWFINIRKWRNNIIIFASKKGQSPNENAAPLSIIDKIIKYVFHVCRDKRPYYSKLILVGEAIVTIVNSCPSSTLFSNGASPSLHVITHIFCYHPIKTSKL